MNKKNKLMISSQILISVVLITQNDEDIIVERLKKINKVLEELKTSYEILIIDNFSQDSTIEKIHKLSKDLPHARTVVLSKNYSTDIAITAGIDHCIGDYVVLFNTYTDPPKHIEKIISTLVNENNDIVIVRPGSLPHQNIIEKLIFFTISKLSSHKHYYPENFLTGLNRKAINSITRTRRKSRNLAYISSLIGLKEKRLKYKPLKKFEYKLRRRTMPSILSTIINTAISNSFKPIRVLTFLGMLLSSLFVFYVFLIVILSIFVNPDIAPQGWISISTVVGTLFFLLFSLLTLISEYIIRILQESRNEPIYFISDEFDKSIVVPKEKKLNIV